VPGGKEQKKRCPCFKTGKRGAEQAQPRGGTARPLAEMEGDLRIRRPGGGGGNPVLLPGKQKTLKKGKQFQISVRRETKDTMNTFSGERIGAA